MSDGVGKIFKMKMKLQEVEHVSKQGIKHSGRILTYGLLETMAAALRYTSVCLSVSH